MKNEKTSELIEKFAGDVMTVENSSFVKGGEDSNGEVVTISGGPDDLLGITGESCNPLNDLYEDLKDIFG